MTGPALRVLGRDAYFAALDEELPAWRNEWYARFGLRPRAFLAHNVVTVQAGNERNEKLLLHEYGHSLGLQHPPVLSLAYWLDLMGCALRVTDANDVAGKGGGQAWLAEQKAAGAVA
ncbi:MAG: hypothetical protein ACYDCK_01560 [Thermoplasmatota archaeon]